MNNHRVQKVLLFYAPIGMGHFKAAKALEESFQVSYPEIEVKIINVLDYTGNIFKKGLPFLYNLVSNKTPYIYKIAYEYYDLPTLRKLYDKTSKTFIKPDFFSFIEKFSPDFMLSTHPLGLHFVSWGKIESIYKIPSANVCTDFGCHTIWCNKDVNYYFVSNNEVKKFLVACGIKDDIIHVTGIPIGIPFSQPHDQGAILSKLKFNKKNPTLLIVGGQLPLQKLRHVVSGIQEKNKTIQFIIVAGRDEGLYKNLLQDPMIYDPMVRVYGFVDTIAELMAVADIIFSKAGGSTVSECMAMGLPMIVCKIIPGQEEDNISYMVKRNAAIWANNTEDVVHSVLKIFSDPQQLSEMKKACLEIGRPKASFEVVRFVKSIMDKG